MTYEKSKFFFLPEFHAHRNEPVAQVEVGLHNPYTVDIHVLDTVRCLVIYTYQDPVKC